MLIYGKPLKEMINVWPKWLWALNIFAIALALVVILWI
jgi:CHASE2 domain-containing sensor protein